MSFGRRGPPPPPCPYAQDRRSRIPVRQGPNSRYHNPVMNYDDRGSQEPEQPFRYMMVPGYPRGMRPGNYIDPNEKDPFARLYTAQDFIDVEQQEEEMREEWRRNPGAPRLAPGERATRFENLVGTDPRNPYGPQSWAAPDYGEDQPDGTLWEDRPRGSTLTRPPLIERDKLYNETKNNTIYDLLEREWDLDVKLRKEPHRYWKQ